MVLYENPEKKEIDTISTLFSSLRDIAHYSGSISSKGGQRVSLTFLVEMLDDTQGPFLDEQNVRKTRKRRR